MCRVLLQFIIIQFSSAYIYMFVCVQQFQFPHVFYICLCTCLLFTQKSASKFLFNDWRWLRFFFAAIGPSVKYPFLLAHLNLGFWIWVWCEEMYLSGLCVVLLVLKILEKKCIEYSIKNELEKHCKIMLLPTFRLAKNVKNGNR